MLKIGQNVGRWTLISKVDATFWNCVCACGTSRNVASTSLSKATSRSCGCWRRERSSSQAELFLKTHGEATHTVARTPEYRAWTALKNRCSNPTNPAYRWYGGRGISVCQRWADSFLEFLADVGRRPGNGYSIDRYPNPNGNYCPENVRWATTKQQADNRSNRLLLTIDGKTMGLKEWADLVGMPFQRLWFRIYRRGMEPEDAINRPRYVRSI